MAKLQEFGEFVRSASSTIEAPVVRKLRESFPKPAAAPAAPPAPAARATARTADKPRAADPVAAPAPVVAAAPVSPVAPATPAPTTAGSAPSADVFRAPPDAPQEAAPGDSASATRPTAPGAARPAAGRPAPRPGPAVPRATSGPPRMGNNPFTSQASVPPRPASGPAASPGTGAPTRPAGMPPRPSSAGSFGVNRPSPGMMPPRPASGGPGSYGGAGSGGPGGSGGYGARGPATGGPGAGRSAGPAGARGGFAPARPGSPGAGRGGPGAGGPGGAPGAGAGGRPGPGGRGRGGGTAGAFGRGPGGRPTRGRKSKKQRRQEFDNMQAPSIGGVQVPRGNGQVLRLPRGSSLSDFADKIGANRASLVQVMFHLGEMGTATQSVNEETLQLLGAELGYDVQVVSPEDEDRELLESFDLEFGEDEGDEGDLTARPPVVTVMGHVDHGKTKLLDAIRNTNVVAREHGGITQHIGAYQVIADSIAGKRAITFIDTPGHEAFTAMRARGAQVTDIAVLVVAADDGVKPQTIEALNHAQAADVPIVVAVNKIDKEDADPTKVRGQLTEYGLIAEEYGGDTMFVDVSAKSNLNIDKLLEAILLTADAALDMRANADQDAQGVAIEAHLDRGRGPVATVLVQRGTLHVGDSIVAGEAFGRVRAMLDEFGETVAEAGPSRPVQVLGFTSVPDAGDNFLVVPEDRVARQIAERRSARERNA